MDQDVWKNFYRGFFGFNRFHSNERFTRDDDQLVDRNDDDEQQNGLPQTHSPGHFHNFQLITDPLEIQRFLDHQIETMFHEFAGISGNQGEKHSSHRPFEDDTDREMMLKHDDFKHDKREDSDIDEQNLTSDDIARLFKKSENAEERVNKSLSGEDQSATPRRFLSGNQYFGQLRDPGFGTNVQTFSFSRSIQTERRADGSIQIEEWSRNPDGSETRTVRRRAANEETDIPTKFQNVPGNTSELETFSRRFGLGSDDSSQSSKIVIQPPLADRMFTSIFSKFFGS